jgi:hypothetical protein
MNLESATKAPPTLLVLSHTDERLITAVHALRFATALDLIYFLGFSEKSLPYIRSRLSRLSGGDVQRNTYLIRFSRPHTGLGPTEKVWALGARGRDFLHAQGYYRPYNKLAHLSYSMLTHDLTLVRLVCAATAWVRQQSTYTLVQTTLSHELSRMPGMKAVPDAYLRYEKDGKSHPIWIEVDCNGTEFQVQWKKYLRQRLAFIRSDGYAEVFHTRSVLMAYVVGGPSAEAREVRRQKLCSYTQEVLSELGLKGWASIFRFTSVEYKTLYDAPLFSGEVWRSPDAPETPLLLFSA